MSKSEPVDAATKARRSVAEIRNELDDRLRRAGCPPGLIDAPRAVDKIYVYGRNWDASIAQDCSPSCRDIAMRVIREVGNEFDCASFPKRPALQRAARPQAAC